MKNKITPILSLVFCEHLGINIIFPALTFIFFSTHHYFHGNNKLWYGLSISAYQIGAFFGSPLLSLISDYFDRKKILILGIGSVFIMSLLGMVSMFLKIALILVIGRFIGGFFLSNAISQAVVGDISKSNNKLINMGLLQGIIALSAFFGPWIAGYFSKSVYFFHNPIPVSFIIVAVISFIYLILFKQIFTLKILTD